ncbi:MAG: flippase-like domain-containing protein [bacterium]|nr:flippase-like domain-containing protein [bacterium]
MSTRNRGKAALTRVLGVLIALSLLAFAASKVPWRDTVNIGDESYPGTLLSDFKVQPVRFAFDADQVPSAGSPLVGHAAATALAHGGEIELREGVLTSRVWSRGVDGGAVAANDPPAELTFESPEDLQWRPGMPRAFSDANLVGILPALGFLFFSSLLIVTRWWRLLALIGCPTRWPRALRLTYVGLFFNIALPGVNGGDLARALLVARGHPDRRADAVSSVLVDRILGLVAMAIVAVVAIFIAGDRLTELKLPVALALTGMVVGLAAFLNPTLRHLTHFDTLLGKLPQGRRLQSLDRAMREYSKHPGEVVIALLLSSGNHLCNAAAVAFIGAAFGAEFSFLDYVCVVTVANTLSAIPLSPGGLGVAEVAFGSLFELLESGAYMLGVATSITYRLSMWSLGLVGGLVMLMPGGREAREQFAEQRAGTGPSA